MQAVDTRYTRRGHGAGEDKREPYPGGGTRTRARGPHLEYGQAAALESPEAAADLAYWRETLGGRLPELA
ncbi:hypothetical protein, partial [Streptomyces roseoverticillatus]